MEKIIFKFYLSLSVAMMIVLLTMIMDAAQVKASPAVVSSVVKDPATGKSYLQVDGKPFLYNAAQVNYPGAPNQEPTTTWGDLVSKAAAVNYNVMSFWTRWRTIEPTEGNYDWTEINNVIDAANQYGIRLDLIWGGVDFVGFLSGTFAPDFILNDQSLLLKDSNGNLKWGSMTDRNTGQVYWYNYPDLSNSVLLQKEETFLTAFLNHLQAYDTNHRVILFQVENETNGDSWTQQSSTVVSNYMNQIAGLVKNSNYQIATRANYTWSNGQAVVVPEYDNIPNIDGHGPDPYTNDVATIRNLINSPVFTKMKYISENSGYNDATSLVVAALANGGFYSTYTLDHDYYFGYPGIYDVGWAWDQTTYNMYYLNLAMNRMASLIASSPRQSMAEFNNETNTPSTTYNATKYLNSHYIGFQSRSSAPVGLVVSQGPNYLVAADNDAYVTVDSQPFAVESGYFDQNGNWVKTADRTWTLSGSSYQIQYNKGECLKIYISTPTNLLSNSGFENGLSNWSTMGGTLPGYIDSQPHSGTNDLSMWSTNAYTSWLENDSATNLTAGTYTASVWYRSGGTFNAAQLAIYDGGTLLASSNLPVSAGYVQVPINNISIPQGHSLRVGIWVDGQANSWITLDDFQLYKNNLLLNPGFEANLSNWSTTGGNIQGRVDTGGPRSGTNDLNMWSANAYTSWLENDSAANLTAGTYTASVWYRSGGTFNAAQLAIYDGSTLLAQTNLPVSAGFVRMPINNISVPQGHSLRVGIWVDGQANSWIYLDDFELYKN